MNTIEQHAGDGTEAAFEDAGASAWAAAATSHALRTPLTVVLGMSALLREHWDTLSEPQRQSFAERIEDSSTALAAALAEVLATSGSEQRRLEPRATDVPLEAALVQALASQPGCRLRLVGRNATLRCDPYHLNVMLTTAIQALAQPGGAPDVIVRARREGAHVRFCIERRGSRRSSLLRDRAATDGGTDHLAQTPALRLLHRLARENAGAAWISGRSGARQLVLLIPAASRNHH